MQFSVKATPFCVIASLCASQSAFGQSMPSAPPPPAPAIASVEPAVISAPDSAQISIPKATPVAPPAMSVPAGTIIEIEITEPVDSKDNDRGDKFTLKLAAPVLLNGREVLPEGTPGVGEVIDAEASGFGGRPGKLVLAARYLEYRGLRIPLKAFKVGGAGRDHANLSSTVAIAAGVLAGPAAVAAGIFIRGGNITYAVGARANAKLAADFTPVEDAAAPTASAATPEKSIVEGNPK